MRSENGTKLSVILLSQIVDGREGKMHFGAENHLLWEKFHVFINYFGFLKISSEFLNHFLFFISSITLS